MKLYYFVYSCFLLSLTAVSPEDKQVILDVHNELRGKAVPTATNMMKLVRYNNQLIV